MSDEDWFPTDEAVEGLVALRRSRPAWQAIPVGQAPCTIEQGYALQAAVHDRLARHGAPRIGFKIGSTSPKTQKALGLSAPVYAGIFEETRSSSLRDGLSRPLAAPSVECEIAVVLARDVDATQPSLGVGDVRDAIASCLLSCEIIDNRYGKPLAAGIPSLLADDFFHAGFVLGPPNPNWQRLNLARLNATVTVNETVHRGNTADALAAADAVLWLARALAGRGARLRAGDIVLTGSILAPIAIAALPGSLSLHVDGFEPLEFGQN